MQLSLGTCFACVHAGSVDVIFQRSFLIFRSLNIDMEAKEKEKTAYSANGATTPATDAENGTEWVRHWFCISIPDDM